MSMENTEEAKGGLDIEGRLERTVFSSRWLLAPFYVGLMGAILIVLWKFLGEFWHLAVNVGISTEGEAIVGILTLIDMALIGNLLIIIIFSGYENFVSKIDTADHVDRPDWMGHVDFSDLKMKVIGSIVAISAIELLKAFMASGHGEFTADTQVQLQYKIAIHLTFVLSGVLFALMDWLSSLRARHH